MFGVSFFESNLAPDWGDRRLFKSGMRLGAVAAVSSHKKRYFLALLTFISLYQPLLPEVGGVVSAPLGYCAIWEDLGNSPPAREGSIHLPCGSEGTGVGAQIS
jgi:hypothetical protein